jgi:HSP20 family protein
MMRRMAEDMDRLFGNFGFGLQPAAWAPQVETFRRGDQLVVRADLPGMKKDDVNVEVEDGVLTISGERCDEHEEKRDDSYRSERTYGQFYRAIPLPEGVNGDQCDASFKDGVLEVTLPVPKETDRKAKKIQVR